LVLRSNKRYLWKKDWLCHEGTDDFVLTFW
jgi:hypothetical protein